MGGALARKGLLIRARKLGTYVRVSMMLAATAALQSVLGACTAHTLSNGPTRRRRRGSRAERPATAPRTQVQQRLFHAGQRSSVGAEAQCNVMRTATAQTGSEIIR